MTIPWDPLYICVCHHKVRRSSSRAIVANVCHLPNWQTLLSREPAWKVSFSTPSFDIPSACHRENSTDSARETPDSHKYIFKETEASLEASPVQIISYGIYSSKFSALCKQRGEILQRKRHLQRPAIGRYTDELLRSALSSTIFLTRVRPKPRAEEVRKR